MKNLWGNPFRKRPTYRRIAEARPLEFLVTEACVGAIATCIEPQTQRRHEGIVYLYGRTDGHTTLAVGAIRPHARTTAGSFHVQSTEMARLVREIRRNGLQLICQLHTHPGKAYHSDGDVEGLKLICDGYVSIVLPNYGAHLPSFEGAVFYFYRKDLGFSELKEDAVRIVPSRML